MSRIAASAAIDSGGAGSAFSLDPDRESALERAVLAGLAARKAAGMVIRLELDGALAFEKAWGFALDTPALSRPMKADTVFDLASLTKIFTTTAVLRLATLGRLDLDAPLSSLPNLAADAAGLPRFFSALKAISARDLLTHASGLHYWYPFYAAKAAAPPGNGAPAHLPLPAALAENEAHENPPLPPAYALVMEEILGRFPLRPGTVYSDLNFILLGRLVERLEDAPLDEAMARLVLEPLGLKRSAYRPPRAPASGAAASFAATEFGNRIEEGMVADLELSFEGWRPKESAFEGEPDDGNCHYFFGDVAGHAGIFSTASELCALGRLYLGLEWKGFLDRSLIEDARRDHGGGRGLGFQLGELYSHEGFGHTGFTGTCLYLNAKEGMAAAILANRLHVPEPVNINEWRRELIDILYSVPKLVEGRRGWN